MIHDRAVILASGDEIVTGQLLDTNSRWIAERLMDAGIVPVEHVTVADDQGALSEALGRAAAMAPLVILSGGLGPTEGDLMRQAVCAATGDRLVTDEGAARAITELLGRRGRPVTERQLRQAQRPSRAECLANAFGTAPGLHVRMDGPGAGGRGGGEAEGVDLFCLPGPPGELRPMWWAHVGPRLRPDPSRVVAARLLHIAGVPEADAVTRLGDLTRRDPPPGAPLVGITASGGVLTLRIRSAPSGSLAAAEDQLEQAEAYARRALGDHVFARAEPGAGQRAGGGGGTGGGSGAIGSGGGVELTGVEHLAREVLELLKARGRTLVAVESCTGGGLGELVTRIAGSSAAFVGGFVAYANAMKEALGVSGATLAAHGAVSREVAVELARAGLARSGADHALAITGVAGPDGGTPIKPVGTVHIAHAWRGGGSGSGGAGGGPAAGSRTGADGMAAVDARRFLITGDREDIRRRAAATGLAMLYFHLARDPAPVAGEPRLLWQMDGGEGEGRRGG